MKKTIFTRVLMMAMMAVVSMTMLTACGGDDVESGGKESGGGTSTSFKYIVPYTQWGASSEKVDADMTQIGWYKEDESEKYSGIFSTVYSAPDESAAYMFIFNSNKLSDVILTYNGCTESNFQTLRKETERVYGVTLELNEASTSTETLYSENTTVNGKYVLIVVGGSAGLQQMYVSLTTY